MKTTTTARTDLENEGEARALKLAKAKRFAVDLVEPLEGKVSQAEWEARVDQGLMPITQRALYFLPILAYHDYEGLGLEDSEREAVARDLGDKWALILRNHGTLTVGRSVGQAYTYMYFLERACQYQVAALAAGAPIRKLPQRVIDLVPQQATHFASAGLLEWPALLASLDADGAHFRC